MKEHFHPLHEKDKQLQTAPEVSRAVLRKEIRSVDEHGNKEKVPNHPNQRIEAYIDRLENIFLSGDGDKRGRNIDLFRDQIYDKLIIHKEDFPESYFELQQRIARERGQPVEVIPENIREQMMDTAIEDQKKSLDSWIDYLSSSDAVYPAWFKYFTWKNITKLSQFDKEKGEFKKRTKSTVAPYPDIYREPLAQIADLYEKVKNDNKALDDEEVQAMFSKKFPDLYAILIQESLAAQLENKEQIDGEWVLYKKGEEGAAEKLYHSLEGKGTGWCTAGQSTAKIQIDSGDFYVYYTYDEDKNPTQPRLAIRMQGIDIGEVRGILPHQDVESQLQDVLDEKLQTFGPKAEIYKKKSTDMRRLTDIDNRVKDNQELTKADLRFLYEVDSRIEGFGYEKDPRIDELLKDHNMKADLVLVFECKPEQISTTQEEALSGDIVCHSGVIDLSSLNSAEHLKLPKNILGGLYLRYLKSADGLVFPEHVGWNLFLNDLTSPKGLNLPKYIGGTLGLNSLTSAEGLKLPDHVGGGIILSKLTMAKGLVFPRTIGGGINLSSLITAEGLILPEFIGGDLILTAIESANGLKFPERVPGNLIVAGLTTTEGLTLPEYVDGDLVFDILMNGNNFKLPKHVGGNITFNELTSAESLVLPEYVGKNIYLGPLNPEDKQKLRERYPQHADKIA